MALLKIALTMALGSLALPGAQEPRAVKVRPASPAKVQEARVALVIGNGGYQDGPLRNPVRDARAMKEALEICHFEVTLLTDVDKRTMEDAIRTFGDRLRDGAVGLFYFAGHGLQVEGSNYLIPVGARLFKESDVPYEGVDVGRVLDDMKGAANKLNIVILDACRNNPFALAKGWRSAGEQGLAQVKAPTGSFVAYATAPGATAADGEGDHGVYTQALLEELREPGLKLEEAFKKVREKVLDASRGGQTPWESNSTVGDFYFRPLVGPVDGPSEQELEATLWEGARDTRKPAELEAFLARFPKGRFAELATAKLANLRRVEAAAPDLAEPAKALEKDAFETGAEFAARLRNLGPVVVGKVVLDRRNYSVESGLLRLPIQPAPWAAPYVRMRTLFIPLQRDQAKALVASGDTAQLLARFDAPGGAPAVTAVEVNSSLGRFSPRNGAPEAGAAAWTNALGMKFVKVPAGAFRMGADGAQADERPAHAVQLRQAFWMGAYAVTQAQYEAVAGTNPSRSKEAGPDAPVENVSWDEARAFCLALAELEGGAVAYRLPTEAEWEYACRAGTEGGTYGPIEAIAWCQENSGGAPHPVGLKQPNAFGLYDMLGNVWQWCQDWYGDYPAGAAVDPAGPASGSFRVFRGGGWNYASRFCHAALRGSSTAGDRSGVLGFRVIAVPR